MCTKAVLERYSDKFKILYIESKEEEILGLFLPKESFIFQNYMQEIKTWEYILKRVNGKVKSWRSSLNSSSEIYIQNLETELEPRETSEMELFVKKRSIV